MASTVIIIGAHLTPKRKEKLYGGGSVLHSYTKGRGSKAATVKAPENATPELFTTDSGLVTYVGFVVGTDNSAFAGSSKALLLRDCAISLDENPSSRKMGIHSVLGDSMAEAQRQWNSFSCWADGHGFDLGGGELLQLHLED